MARCGDGRPTVEGSITLDVRHLNPAALVPYESVSGPIQWTWPNSGHPICRADYRATLGEQGGTLHLISITRFGPNGVSTPMAGQTIQLATTVPRYGGRRWWLVCPQTGRPVMKLYLPPGEHVFASRQAHRLGYAVQRESRMEQAYRKAQKARAVIGGGPNLSEKLPGKPKGMRWRTYWRHVEAYRRAEQKTLGLLLASAEKILGGTMGGHETA
jgi:hypothetical protein